MSLLRPRLLIPAALLLVLLPTRAPAQAPGQAGDRNCRGLLRLTAGELSINTARRVPAGEERGARCRVTGQILPDVGFVVLLPDDWNGRFLMQGNGGFAGHFPRWPDYVPDGFALAATDAGHDEDRSWRASFGTDRQKVIDYAYRAVHLTAVTAKEIIAAYYGSGPETSYFTGGSTGGRQGLMAAQRFPADFDGILVGAPVLDQTSTHIWGVWLARAMSAAPIREDQLTLLAERVYATCDTVDGVEDGLVAEPTRCGFEPAQHLPRCDDGPPGPGCFTDAQVGTLEKIYGSVMSDGEAIFPGLPVGGEKRGRIVGPDEGRRRATGWFPWLVNPEGTPANLALARSFLRYMAFSAPDPDYDWRTFDFDEDPRRMGWIRGILDATDPDLSVFRDRGGKILMYFGWADVALNPLMGTRYYEDVRETLGPSTRDFFRLFMIPGLFHGYGGVGDPRFERFAPLRRWVEEGIPPAAW